MGWVQNRDALIVTAYFSFGRCLRSWGLISTRRQIAPIGPQAIRPFKRTDTRPRDPTRQKRSWSELGQVRISEIGPYFTGSDPVYPV